MSVEFKDYYAILGVPKDASQADIKKAFRKHARACHPDLAKAEDRPGAEARFKEINEAYEVLKNPESRAKYDQLGSNWKAYEHAGHGADAGRGYAAQQPFGDSQGGYEFRFGGTGFSDFFERFFGGMGGDPFNDVDLGSGGRRPFGRQTGRRRRPAKGADVEAEIMVTLEEALNGASRRISLSKIDERTGAERMETLNVKIPAGVRDGQRIRLSGQGQPSPGKGEPGDLYLRARLAQHPYFKVKNSDLHYELSLAPWEAVLGATVMIPTLQGSAKVTVAPGTQDGRQLRLRGHGLPKAASGRGDLLAEVRIRVPKTATEEEKALWSRLRERSGFNPRNGAT